MEIQKVLILSWKDKNKKRQSINLGFDAINNVEDFDNKGMALERVTFINSFYKWPQSYVCKCY